MKRFSYLNLILIIFLVYSCIGNNNASKNFNLSSSLKSSVNKREYTSLIDRASNCDSIAFNNLLYYSINDGNIIEHSSVICRLIKTIGQERICYWIKCKIININDLSSVMMFSAYHVYTEEEFNIFLDKSFKFKCDSTKTILQ